MTTDEFAKRAGITRSTLYSYMSRGIITPPLTQQELEKFLAKRKPRGRPNKYV